LKKFKKISTIQPPTLVFFSPSIFDGTPTTNLAYPIMMMFFKHLEP